MGVTLYNSDCVVTMKQLHDCSIDLTVTSPPYDDLREYNKSSCWNFDKFKSVADELYRITKDGGVVVWVVNDQVINGSKTGTSFKQALYFKDIGFNINDVMIWQKDSFRFPDSVRYGQVFEYMFIFSKGKPKTLNKIKDRRNRCTNQRIQGTVRQKDGIITPIRGRDKVVIGEYGERHNIWQINPEKNNVSGHPAVFPVQLALDHIVSWSNEGDTVFDPFLGSGTTGVACVKTNRNFIGCEIDKTYFNIAENRINSENKNVLF